MPDSSNAVSLDLTTLARLYQTGAPSPRETVALVLVRLHSFPAPAVWIHRTPEEDLLARARGIDSRRAEGAYLRLAGVRFAVTDEIDVAGMPTSAAWPAFSY